MSNLPENIKLEAILTADERKRIRRISPPDPAQDLKEFKQMLKKLLEQTLEEFLMKAGNSDARMKLYQETGILPGDLERWAIQGDLLRLNYVRENTLSLQDARYLLQVGIDGLAGLMRSSAQAFWEHLTEIQNGRNKGELRSLFWKIAAAKREATRDPTKLDISGGQNLDELTSSHNLLVVSDLHIGEGWDPETQKLSPNEDFLYDQAFAHFLAYHQLERESVRRTGTQRDRPWRLIINGDFVDFLQVTSSPSQDELVKYQIGELDPERVRWGLGSTINENRWKARRIYRGHPIFFQALAWFLAYDKHTQIVIQTGNHDIELIWKKVRKEIRGCIISASQQLAEPKWMQLFSTFDLTDPHISAQPSDPLETTDLDARLTFTHWLYYEPGVALIEHGCQYETANSWGTYFDPRYVGAELHLNKKRDQPEQLLWPWGSLLVRYLFNRVERTHPFADQMKPYSRYFTWAFRNHPFTMVRLLVGSARGIFRTVGQAWQRGTIEGWLGSSSSISTLLSMTVRGLRTGATWGARFTSRKWLQGETRYLEWPVFDWAEWMKTVKRSEQSVAHLSEHVLRIHRSPSVIEDQVLLNKPEYGARASREADRHDQPKSNTWSFLTRLLEFLLQFGVVYSFALATRSILGWKLDVPEATSSIRAECGLFIQHNPETLFDFMSGWAWWGAILGFLIVVPLILLILRPPLDEIEEVGWWRKLIAVAVTAVSFGTFIALLFRVWCNFSYFREPNFSPFNAAIAWPQWLGWVLLLVLAMALPTAYEERRKDAESRGRPRWQLVVVAGVVFVALVAATGIGRFDFHYSAIWIAWAALGLFMLIFAKLWDQSVLLFLFLWAVLIGLAALAFALLSNFGWVIWIPLVLVPLLLIGQKWKAAFILLGVFAVLWLMVQIGLPKYQEYVVIEMEWKWLPLWAFWGALGLWSLEGKNNPYTRLGLQGVQSWWVRVLGRSAALSMEAGLVLLILGIFAQFGFLLSMPKENQVIGVAIVLVLAGILGRKLYDLAQLESSMARFKSWLGIKGCNSSSRLLGYGLAAITFPAMFVLFGQGLLNSDILAIVLILLLLLAAWRIHIQSKRMRPRWIGLTVGAYSKGLSAIAAIILFALVVRAETDRPYGRFLMSREERQEASVVASQINNACSKLRKEIAIVVRRTPGGGDTQPCDMNLERVSVVVSRARRGRNRLIELDSQINNRIENLDPSAQVLETLGVWEKAYFIVHWSLSSLLDDFADPSAISPQVRGEASPPYTADVAEIDFGAGNSALKNELNRLVTWRLDQLRALSLMMAAIDQQETVQVFGRSSLIALSGLIIVSAVGVALSVYLSRYPDRLGGRDELGSREQLRRLSLLARRKQHAFALGFGQWTIVALSVLFGIGLILGPLIIVSSLLQTLESGGKVLEAIGRGNIVDVRVFSANLLRFVESLESEAKRALGGGLVLTLGSLIGRWILSRFSKTLPVGGGYLSKVAREICYILGRGETGLSSVAMRPVPYLMFGHDHHPAFECLTSDSTSVGSNDEGLRQWYGNTGAWVQTYSGEVQYRHEDEGHSVFAKIIPGPDTTGTGAPLTLLRWDHAVGRPARMDHLVEAEGSRHR